jgi:UDP-N-acetylmuramoylalanine--D-glutamate ligase
LTGKAAEPGRVLVVGAGRTGRSVVSFVDRLGGSCYITDDSGAPSLSGLEAAADVVEAADAVRLAREVDMVVPSPGVPPTHPVIREALSRDIPVVAEIELASRHLDVPLVAITGTNGKSTTVDLAASILRFEGLNVFEGGNMGTPLCEAYGGRFDYCVAEVSSFQLEWVDTFEPLVGVLLNISPDHLDRHADMQAYVAAKVKMFAHMGPRSYAVVGSGEFQRDDLIASIEAPLSSFGPVLATATGTRLSVAERSLFWGDGAIALAEGWPFAPHDFENAAAAAEIARVLGVPAASVQRALSDFRPLAHRLAPVGESGGVSFWDDSKATNVGATLRSLEAFEHAVILMAGGVPKGTDFSPLAAAAGKLKLVVGFGNACHDIGSAIAGAVDFAVAGSMREAFDIAVARAVGGDTVLLAPACASFDEFRDYAERGEAFVRMVEELGGQV